MDRVTSSPQWTPPRGWIDLVRQAGIWLGFVLVYQVARGVTRRDASTALANGRSVLALEERARLAVELRLQRSLLGLGALVDALDWTYWLSQFVVVGLALLWIYLRRNASFLLVRDVVIVANTTALIVYALLPTAPPRLLPDGGVVDTLLRSHTLNHGSGIVELAENPYAAMPSVHTADALIVAIALVVLVRPLWLKILWACWPCWVAFALVVSGNHYLADVAAGALLVAVTAPPVIWLEHRLGRAC
jgi:membrane-associated phospholipid phosphatase